jgi:hypothetical protein
MRKKFSKLPVELWVGQRVSIRLQMGRLQEGCQSADPTASADHRSETFRSERGSNLYPSSEGRELGRTDIRCTSADGAFSR